MIARDQGVRSGQKLAPRQGVSPTKLQELLFYDYLELGAVSWVERGLIPFYLKKQIPLHCNDWTGSEGYFQLGLIPFYFEKTIALQSGCDD